MAFHVKPSVERQMICKWREHACRYHWLFMQCGPLEIPAYRELSDPNSAHAQEGLDFCSIIEKATGIPTFYFLERHWGRKKREEDRPCPLCGKDWRIKGKKKSNKIDYLFRFWDFDYQCKPCRIVSHVAFSCSDERHARIGEYKGKQKMRH